eukprot:gb/GEZN01009803.1/.p1 GENE.gb/GEZN01009803.1/~~gb/GEZN01009803.1/.p1  ORF type:complete len:263 (-),score=34.40 gb/GEZN01009803.1/:434-1222(-)
MSCAHAECKCQRKFPENEQIHGQECPGCLHPKHEHLSKEDPAPTQGLPVADLIGFISSYGRGLEEQVTAAVQLALGNVEPQPELQKVYDPDGNIVAEWDGVLSGTVLSERAIVLVEAKSSVTQAHIDKLKEKQALMNKYIQDCLNRDSKRGQAYTAALQDLRVKKEKGKKRGGAGPTEHPPTAEVKEEVSVSSPQMGPHQKFCNFIGPFMRAVLDVSGADSAGARLIYAIGGHRFDTELRKAAKAAGAIVVTANGYHYAAQL